MILGEEYLNPQILSYHYNNELDSLIIDFKITFLDSIRDEVKIFHIQEHAMGIWNKLAGNQYFYADQFLGTTNYGKASIIVPNQKHINLMFIDRDKCVDIVGLELSYKK